MPALAAAVWPRLSEFGPQEVANVSWALAVETMVVDPLLRGSLALQVQRCACEFDRKELVNSLWAFAVFGSCELRSTNQRRPC
mmetsp:Transcript_505/g.446  ORF Transcript_505/g.446 Transcript_505/m.446 type:complete len:83 (+) Transcript_505:24-272(+)